MPRRRRREYDSVWTRLSLEVRREAGFRCEVCGAKATSTDHIVPIREAPDLRLVRSNLRATCAKHNQGRVFARVERMAHLNRRVGETRDW